MFDLNAAIDEWVTRTVKAHPGLAPHSDELADHVLSLSEALITDGQPPTEAFAQALEALGDPSDLADEFRKDGGVVALVRRFTDIDRVPSKRQQRAVSIAYIVLSLFWAGVIIAVDTWVVLLWTVTTFLPLSALGTLMAKQLANAESDAGRTRRSC